MEIGRTVLGRPINRFVIGHPAPKRTAAAIFSQPRGYTNGSEDGWWFCPYGCQNGGALGLSQETILRPRTRCVG